MAQPLYLPCPNCNKVHLDEDDWANRQHHIHRCVDDHKGKGCGHEWDTTSYTRGVSLEDAQMYDYAQLGYEAYNQNCGGIAFNGDKLPSWENVKTKIQENWLAAARAIRN